MTVWTYDFESGTPGSAVATTDTPSLGDTALSTVTIGTGATFAYDTTRAHTGSQALKVVTTAGTSASSFGQWGSGVVGTSLTQIWLRAYFYFTALPAGNTRILGVYTGGTQDFVVQLLSGGGSSGKIQQLATGNIVMATGTYSFPFGQWVRVEATMVCSATAGWGEVKTFGTTPEGTSPDETLTSAASFATGTALSVARYGQGTVSSAGLGPFWADDIAASDTGYIGATAGTSAKADAETETGAESAPVLVGVNDAAGGAI